MVLGRLGHDDLADQQAPELQRLQATEEEFTSMHEQAFQNSTLRTSIPLGSDRPEPGQVGFGVRVAAGSAGN
jgi:hypothetical protein